MMSKSWFIAVTSTMAAGARYGILAAAASVCIRVCSSANVSVVHAGIVVVRGDVGVIKVLKVPQAVTTAGARMSSQ